MKKTFSLCLLIYFLSSTNSSAQTSITAGPEQKVKAVMRLPDAVKPGSSFTVKIEITKGSISGLGRFQQYLPKGMTATATKNDGADFTFENQTVKFIWVSLPQKESVTIQYNVTTEASLSTTKTLSGTFSYVENGRTKTYSIVPKEIRIDANAPVEDPVAEEPEKKREPLKDEAAPVMVEAPSDSNATKEEETKTGTDTVVAQKIVEVPEQITEEKKPPAVIEEKIIALENIPVNKTSASPVSNPAATASAAGVIFRVQIAAMNEKRFRKDGHFQKAFNLEETVYNEVHDGLKKYTVGNCASYKAARSMKKEIISHVDGAFIVAYYDGVRIPVADAIALLKKN